MIRCCRIAVVIGLLGSITTLRPCDVPVCRYAMINWPADNYTIVWVFHTDSISVSSYDSLLLSSSANYLVRKISADSPAGKSFMEQHAISALPWMQVAGPYGGVNQVLWSGPLTRDHVNQIIQSPARTSLIEQLSKGDAAVWLLLKCGDAVADQKAEQILHQTLQKINAERSILNTGNDESFSFSEIEINRSSAEEKFFIDCLLSMESDLDSWKAPMLFPVFGRGRVLYALVGEGIRENTILDACRAIVGWCSCEVKGLNPGYDLLLSADWTRLFSPLNVRESKPVIRPDRHAARRAIPSSFLDSNRVISNLEQKKLLEHSLFPKEDPGADSSDYHASSPQSLIKTPMIRNLAIVFGFSVLIVLFGLVLILKNKRDS